MPVSKEKNFFCFLLCLFFAVVLVGYLVTGNLDTVGRRKAVSAKLQSLASQYRDNLGDQGPLREIRKIASGPYVFGRSYAMGILADLSKVDGSVIADIGRGLRDENPFVRHSAGAAITKVAVPAQEAIDDLLYIIKEHPNEGASSFAVEAIMEIGDSSKKVLDALEASAKAKDSYDDEFKRKAYRILSGREMP